MNENKRYDELVCAFGINYLNAEASRVQVEGKFCLVDNLQTGGWSIPTISERPSPIHFPIKITLGFCLFCKSGQVSIRVQQRDYTVSDNSALVVFAGQIVEKVDVRKDTKLIFAALDSEYIMTGIRGPHGKNIRQMMIHSHEPIRADLGETEGDNFIHLCQSVKHIISNCDSQTADGILSGFSYIFASLLLKWTRQGTQNLSLSASREKEILLRFEEDLHNFSRKDKTVSFYARRQCISDKHFSRTIKKACGRKPLDIIREYVILDAKSLLLTGRYSVKEVSEKLGFTNDSFFCRYFKLATGKSPLEFLKSAQN